MSLKKKSSAAADDGADGKARRRGDGARKHLDADEVERLIKAAGSVGRHGARDALMILMGFRHGFRASEIVDLCRPN